MGLSRIEQETIILFNEEEKTASVETHNRAMMNALEQMCAKSSDIYRVSAGDGWAKYVCPKSWVKVRMPRQYSEEQRQIMAERARANFAKEG